MNRPVAVEVRNLSKSYHIPGARLTGLRNRRRSLTGRAPGRELHVLRDLSFDVEQGEFFGIVGRNGSGKSTLLKVLASVYRVDSGRIRIAGRLAPFLELGIGFNPQLTALDNVILNGVMMGLTATEARRRFDEVVEFAGLEEYLDLQIKNYSSGMKVRLGFAVMTHVDADLLLVDEVLAVGDADFQEKCTEVFLEMHKKGRTILLVTHSMPTVTDLCDRALLLDDGEINTLGGPDLVAERYYTVCLDDAIADSGDSAPELLTDLASAVANPVAQVMDIWLADAIGNRADSVSGGDPINVQTIIGTEPDSGTPRFKLGIVAHDGQLVFSTGQRDLSGWSVATGGGQEMLVTAKIENRLPAGRYRITIDLYTESGGLGGHPRAKWITVTGDAGDGAVLLNHEISVTQSNGTGAPA